MVGHCRSSAGRFRLKSRWFPRRAYQIAPLSRNVGQPDHILVNSLVSHQAEPRPRAGEIWRAAAKHYGVEVDPILVDQAKVRQASGKVRSANLDLPVDLGLQLPYRRLEVTLDQRGWGRPTSKIDTTHLAGSATPPRSRVSPRPTRDGRRPSTA
jgi:hypothetical protein